jgi:hypothetical protein
MTTATQYIQNFDLAEQLFDKIRHGGKLHLVSHDEQLSVDVHLKHEYGVYWLGVKRSTDKQYSGHCARSKSDVVTYLSQFREREDNE